ncbi:MAG: HD domain-containing protein [Clostridiales bacterium]|nr:HD domain-containing protein [Clostridiales bacterium]
MKYTDRLLHNERFLQIMREVQEDERERIYCHHELEHGLDVARIAWILCIENSVTNAQDMDADRTEREERKDRIYVAGLIHDIGRSAQCRTGEHHAIAGVRLARQILTEVGYPREWIDEVCCFIREHHGRQYRYEDKSAISYYIERADQLSRNCFCCPAADTCKWEESEKNRSICR